MEPTRYIRGAGLPAEMSIEAEAAPIFPDENEPLVDVWAYWRVVRKRLRLIAAITAAVIVVVFVHVMNETPIYTAEATILIEPNASSGGSSTLENLVEIETAAANADQYYKTQCAMLQSRKLAVRVIDKLDLMHNPVFAPKAHSGGLFAALWPHLHRAPGGAATKPRISAEVASGNAATDTPAMDEGQEVSPQVPDGIVHAYLNGLKVKPVEDTNLVKISFSTPDPALSARLASAHIYEYGQQQQDVQGEQSDQAQKFLEVKLAGIKDSLQKSEAQLNQFRRDKNIIPGLVSLDGKDAVVLDRLSELSKDLTRAKVARIGLEAQVELIHKHDFNSLPTVTSSPAIEALNTELNHLYTEQAALASQFKPDYPPLAKLDAKIHEVQVREASEVNNAVAGIQSQYQEAMEKEKELQDEMDAQQKETLKLNDSAAQYAILQREVDTNRELYNAVLTRMKDVEVSGNIQSTNVETINPAEVPTAPTSPNKMRALLLALVVGLGGSIGLAFCLEFLDNTLKNPQEVENYLHLPNLGVVPEFSALNGKTAYGPLLLKEARPTTTLPPGRELVTSYGSYSMLGEAYRSLRTALLLSRAGAPPKVLLITSAMSREGKTVTAVNTAVMLAQLGSNVLLIDADLRRARCHRVLAVDNHLGLTEVLTGSRELHEMIRQTEIENLHFLSSGSVPPNPTELLGSSKLGETLGRLREHYEYIVIDSPPVLPVSDSMLLAKVIDGAMLVANASATPRQQVKAACARLEYARAKILGVVLNKVKVHSADYQPYHYHQDYYPTDGDSFLDDEEPA